jgi:hypothetical protein
MYLGRALVLAALAALPATSQVTAAVTLTGDDQVVVASHEVIDDDLIVYATYVRVDGVVKGDLVAIGEEVVVEGVVEGDLFAAGKTLYLNGAVGDDARVLAYALALGEQARVGDDLFALSYSLDTRADSRVGGSLHAASKQASLAGQVVEEIFVRAGALLLAGLTGGGVHAVVGGLEGVPSSSFVIDIDLELPDVPEGVTVAGTAAIGGDLEYRAPEPARVAREARIAGALLHERTPGTGPIVLADDPAGPPSRSGARTRDAVERLATLLVIGLVLAVAVPGWMQERGALVRGEPAGTLFFGLAALVVSGLVALLFGIACAIWMVVGLSTGWGGVAVTAITVGALAETAIATLFGFSLFYLGPVLASAGIGGALVERFRPAVIAPVVASPLRSVLTVALGASAYTLLRALPWLGPLVAVLGALVGLGALAAWLRDLFLPFERPLQPLVADPAQADRNSTSGR